MEDFPSNLMLFFTFALTFLLEMFRYRLLSALKLHLDWEGGWRYAYYLPFLAVGAGLGSGLSIPVIAALDLAWVLCMRNTYLGGAFLVSLAGVIVSLLYVALRKIKTTRELAPLLGFLTLLDLVCFVWKPTRFIFGGTLLLLVSSAAGRLVRFTGWKDMVQWLQGKEDTGHERIPVRLFIEADGFLSRRGDRLELSGEQISNSTDDPVNALARRLLDRGRLTEIIAALERLQQRDDLLATISPLIAQNIPKIIALHESLSQAEGTPQQKQELLQKAIQALLDQRLGDQMRSVLYWHYDLPKEEVRLFVSRAPRADLKPMIGLREYLGLVLTWWARRGRKKKKYGGADGIPRLEP